MGGGGIGREGGEIGCCSPNLTAAVYRPSLTVTTYHPSPTALSPNKQQPFVTAARRPVLVAAVLPTVAVW